MDFSYECFFFQLFFIQTCRYDAQLGSNCDFSFFMKMNSRIVLRKIIDLRNDPHTTSLWVSANDPGMVVIQQRIFSLQKRKTYCYPKTNSSFQKRICCHLHQFIFDTLAEKSVEKFQFKKSGWGIRISVAIYWHSIFGDFLKFEILITWVQLRHLASGTYNQHGIIKNQNLLIDFFMRRYS